MREFIKSELNEYLDEIYSQLNSRKKYGDFHKALFHVHTPASYDYEFLSEFDDKGKKFKELLNEEIFSYVVENRIVPENIIAVNEIQLDSLYKDIKEYLTFLLIAKKLIDNEVELIVISDHNTINGYEKLKKAIEFFYDKIYMKKYPEVILGIEISCADKIHIVGIFDEENEAEINQWIEDNIMSEEEGTYNTSLAVLEYINSINGVGYIAHLDTTDIFKIKKFLSGAYKRKLFSNELLTTIGTSKASVINYISSKVKDYDKKFNFILDNDSHSIDTLNMNVMWVKGEKLNFKTIQDAFRDFDIAVRLESPNKNKNFIRCLAIKPSDDSFFINNPCITTIEKNLVVIPFSDYLNCLIGGRGTGKSTILQMIKFVLTQRVETKEMLDFICKNNSLFIIFHYENDDYLVHFLCPKKSHKDDNILDYFQDANNKHHNYKYYFDDIDRNRIAGYSLKNYINVYKLKIEKDKIIKEKHSKEILGKFFNTDYVTHNLVNITQTTKEMDEFIRLILGESINIKSKIKINDFTSINGLIKTITKLKKDILLREKHISSIIDVFNKSLKDSIRVVVNTEKFVIDNIEFQKLITDYIYFGEYKVRNESLIDYLYMLLEKYGIIYILELFKDEKYNQINSLISIYDYEDDIRDDELYGKEIVIEDFFAEVKRVLFSGSAFSLYKGIIRNYANANNLNTFKLEFNISNKASSKKVKPLFKDVKNVSLGQKVTAMLSLILGHSKYSKECMPLVLDQPEDNLDNQYIYENLVKALSEARNTRQVIMATHNSTIVTNAKAEQVIVLDSEEDKAWIEKTGYPTEESIKKHIVNYLEGGVTSFKHKALLYEDVLEK